MKFKPTLSLLTLAAITLSACAQAPLQPNKQTAAPAAANGQPPAAGAPRPPADPTALKPFAEVSKDFKQDDGLFPIWRKDERVMIEIPRAMLNKPFL
ncbi:MAG: DUF5118 domain-containing protein, partial [Inhella sp.]